MIYRWTHYFEEILAGMVLLTGAHLYGGVIATNAADYVEGEVLVRFRAAETTNSANSLANSHACEIKRHFEPLSRHEGQVICLLHSSKTTAAMLAELRADPAVELAEPNYLRQVTALRAPSDPKFSQQWSFQNTGQNVNGNVGTSGDDIGFLKAWGLARPSTNEVVVGVIDTGLDVTHPDILSNLWTNPGENASNNIDDDGNGYTNDIHGYDFALHTNVITDSGYHGTHVAGTIAASGNNGVGVIGVDFQAHIMALKASSNGSNLTSAAIIEAIQYATTMKNRGVNVVALNASYGGGSSNNTEFSAMLAAGSAGIVFCAAAGNNTNNNDASAVYPASYRLSNMIVVAATDQNDALANFSNYGAATVDIGAPGVNVLSLAPVNQPTLATDVRQSTNDYFAIGMTYAGTTASNGITAPIYYCGLGNPGEFPSGVQNYIALIQRGTLTFQVKVTNAMAAGAVAAIVFNNVAGNFGGTLGVASTNWIPAVSISQADGMVLTNLPGESAGHATATVFNYPDLYQFLDGTSMATPHVAGAVAFAAMNFPAETMAQRIQRILTNATPVGGMAGKVVTGARLNLARIVDTDNNGLPDWWEQQYFGQLTGVATNADADHDGENNLAEFLAGTDPTNSLSVLRLTAQSASSSGVKLQWPSVSGHYYRVLRATNLVAGFTTIVQSNLLATPAVNLFTDTPPAALKSAFYRLQLEP